MRIQGYVKRLLEKNYQNESEIIKDKKYILKISDKCKSTILFKHNILKFEEFKEELIIKAEREKVSIVWAAYIHFLFKIVSAPTSIHMHYSPIFTIPIISDFIRKTIEIDKNIKK